MDEPPMPVSQTSVRTRVRLGSLALLLMCLAFRGFEPLMFLAPGLLYKALDGLRPLKMLLASGLWGVAFAAAFNSWALGVGGAVWLGMAVVRGLPWVALVLPELLLRRFQRRLPPLLGQGLVAGLGLGLVSWVLLLGPTGYDWETPMAALADHAWCLSCLPWLGLAGGGFLIGFVSRLVVERTRASLSLALGIVLVWGGISGLLFWNREPDRVASELTIALLQTGWPEEEKWARENQKESIERLFRMTKQAKEMGASLIVWPETAWPFYNLRSRREDTRAISALAREVEADLLVSSIEETENGWLNSVSQVVSTGRFGHVYNKRRLLPYAEFLPLPKKLSDYLLASGAFPATCRYYPGSTTPILEHQGMKYSLLVCYESMVPELAGASASEVDFFVVVTNDAILGGGYPKDFHFRSAILRAAQFRRPFFQAGNEGVTGVIDRYGTVLKRTAVDFTEPTVLTVFDATE